MGFYLVPKLFPLFYCFEVIFQDLFCLWLPIVVSVKSNLFSTSSLELTHENKSCSAWPNTLYSIVLTSYTSRYQQNKINFNIIKLRFILCLTEELMNSFPMFLFQVPSLGIFWRVMQELLEMLFSSSIIPASFVSISFVASFILTLGSITFCAFSLVFFVQYQVNFPVSLLFLNFTLIRLNTRFLFFLFLFFLIFLWFVGFSLLLDFVSLTVMGTLCYCSYF